jgi:energy-coupling factor transporter ATP-binding protein EcfA2
MVDNTSTFDFSLITFFGMKPRVGEYFGPSTESVELNGSVVAILGRNGSGKSEFLSHLAFSLDPSLPSFENERWFWASGIVLNINDSNNEGISPKDREKLNDLQNNWEHELRWEAMLTIGSNIYSEYGRMGDNFMTWNKRDALQSEFKKHAKIILIPHEAQTFSRESFNDSLSDRKHLCSRIIQVNEDTPQTQSELQQLADTQKKCLQKFLEVEDPKNQHVLSDFILDQSGESLSSPLSSPFMFDGRLVWSSSDWKYSIEESANSRHNYAVAWPHQMASSTFAIAIDATLSSAKFANDLVEILCTTSRNKGLSALKTGNQDFLRKFVNENLPEVHSLLVEFGLLGVPINIFGNRAETLNSDNLVLEDDNLQLQWMSSTNRTIKIWSIRILQCMYLATSNQSLRVAIWDEPEVGLHPSATDSIISRMLPWVNSLGVKVIYASHSLDFAEAADSIVEVHRGEGGVRSKALRKIDDEILKRTGFSKRDLLFAKSKFVFVEGPHDAIVLKSLFTNQLENHRVKIMQFGGTNSLPLPDSTMIFQNLDSEIILVLDGGNAASVGKEVLQRANAALNENDKTSLRQVLVEIRNSANLSKRTETQSLGKYIGNLCDSVEEMDLSRFSIFMLDENDISHYFPIQSLFKKQLPFKSWQEVANARNKEVASGAKDITRRTQEKTYIKKRFSATISPVLLENAARRMQDQVLSKDFAELERLIFRDDKDLEI